MKWASFTKVAKVHEVKRKIQRHFVSMQFIDNTEVLSPHEVGVGSRRYEGDMKWYYAIKVVFRHEVSEKHKGGCWT